MLFRSPIMTSQYNQFVRTASPYIKDKKKGREKLSDKFRNYYPYYYFFENLPEDAPQHAEREKGGVN